MSSHYTYTGSSEEESAAIRMRFPTKIPVSVKKVANYVSAKRSQIQILIEFAT